VSGASRKGGPLRSSHGSIAVISQQWDDPVVGKEGAGLIALIALQVDLGADLGRQAFYELLTAQRRAGGLTGVLDALNESRPPSFGGGYFSIARHPQNI
jgi:hypothetical protein